MKKRLSSCCPPATISKINNNDLYKIIRDTMENNFEDEMKLYIIGNEEDIKKAREQFNNAIKKL